MLLRSISTTVVLILARAAAGAAPVVDASTLNGKVVTGYQGWFGAPGDGNDQQIGWLHWSKAWNDIGPGLYNVDMWPDMSGFDADERYFAPNVQLSDGSPAALFSSRNPKTVARHFKWMKDAGIDGVFLQRFVNELSSPAHLSHRNAVLDNVRAAANAHGRVYAIEYDVSGATESTMASVIAADWQYLVNTLGITNDPRYLYHNGKPVVIVWGLGLQGNPGTPAIASQIISNLKNSYGGHTVIGGVDRGWRTLTIGSKTDPAWATVYRSFDIITPWTIGAYRTTAEINSYRTNLMVPDMNECNSLGIGYLPVVWPGFSWDNLKGLAPGTSGFSRRDGNHLWDQVYSTQLAGANMLFVAMFDEVDEGTAIFKVSDIHPVTDHWVTYDGYPSNWYLRLTGAAQRMLNGAIPLSSTIPICPECGGDEVSFNLGEDVADRMTHIQVGDGDTLVTSIGGKSCRRNVSSSSDLYFYFGVDDVFAYQGGRPTLCITVDYYDTGTGSLFLQYDSNTGDDLPAKYKNGGSVSLTNSQQWRRTMFTVNDAYFGNRQNNGADFRIARSSSGYFYLDRVLVGSPEQVFPMPDHCSIDLGTTDVGNRLTHLYHPTGESATTSTTAAQLNCRMPIVSGDQFFYFAIDDTFLHDESGITTYLEVCYFDDQPSSVYLQPQYDSTSGAYTSASNVYFTNSGKWKTATWTLPNCKFANRQNLGADFRIRVGPYAVKIDSVRVSTVPFTSYTTVERDLGANEIYRGLAHPGVAGTEASTIVVNHAGRSCRRSDGSGAYYFYFNVSDAIIYNGNPSTVYLKVEYYDSPGGVITPQYDSTGGTYTSATTLNFTGTNAWKEAYWMLPNVRFANNQNLGCDFRLWVGTGQNVYIDKVVVSRVQQFGDPIAEPPPTEGTPVLLSAVSVMDHGVAGEYALDINLTAPYSVEPRAGGDHRLELVFDQSIDIEDATVTLSSGSIALLDLATTHETGDTLVVVLGSAPENNACLTIEVDGVFAFSGAFEIEPITLHLGMVQGDVDSGGRVDITDLGSIKVMLFEPVTTATFLHDVNADGSINIMDVSASKNNLFGSAACP